ncbi:DNA-binding protein RFX2-like [Musca domestica]|uniref:DNA-binding protein RFX2-like n=1 Tax=Musca domestica TaxID=7370 RepID=A0ABM3UMV4_MUSDO|nr:DNA-binding protein RFX2-like [Musca domestica]
MTTRLAAAPRNFVLTTAGNTTTAATGIIDTTSSSSPTLTVVSSETTAVDTITTDTNVLPIINATTNDITAVPIETLVTRDSTSLCFNGEEYQFITTEQLQDIMTQKTLVTTAAVTTSAAATTTDLQQQPANTSHQQHNPHHQHHLHQEINGQQSPLSLTTTEAATGPTSVHQDEVAVINVVLPMDNADGSSNEAHQATMDTLAAIKDGVVDLAAHHHNHHHTDPEEGNCPQFITVTVSAQDAGQNYQVQYVDAEQLYHANSTQTQISYPFCPLQEYQTHHQTFYTTAGDFNGIADLSINGNGENGTASIMPYLVPVEENMLLNTSSEDVHSSPQTPNSTSTSAMGSQCLNLITDHDENSMENNEHNHLMGGSNKIASATVKWLSQNYETAEGVSLPRSTLYSHYMQHCQECNIEPVNAASFGKLIRSVFAGLRTRRLGTRGNSKYHYYGIRIKSDSLLKNHEEEKSPQSQKILQHSKHSAAGVVSSSMHNSQSTTSPGKLQSGNTSDSSPTSSSSISSLHTSNRKLSKKIIFKPETFATCSQLLGDGTGAVPCFPLIELDHTFPPEISIQDVDLFRVRYQEHCEKFLEAILNLEFNTIEYLWRDFWQQASEHHHLDKYLSKRKWDFLCLSTTIQKFVQDIDYQFFQNMVDVIIPDVLRSMPNALTQAIRNFASNMEIWLSDCMSGVPEQMIQIKTSTVSAFCQTLRRYTSLNHLAQAAKAVLQNSAQISQMLKDLSRVDFHNVQEQAAWVCQCDPQIVQQFENDFKTTLQQKSSLEQWASWLQLVVDTALQEYQGKPTYPKAARQFLLKWCLYSSMVIRDLTLRSAPSFGSFHLIRLLYDEYMFYLVEHKIAQAQQKTTIAVICDRNERNLNIELDYQLEFINSADTSSSLHSEPEAKRMKHN